MKNLTHLVRAPKMLFWGLLGAGLYSLVSCATMTPAQQTTMAGNALMTSSEYMKNPKDARDAVLFGSLLAIYGQMQHEIEVAKAGRNQVIINNNPSKAQEEEVIKYFNNVDRNKLNYEQRNTVDKFLSKDKKTGWFFMHQKWVDFDKDGEGDMDEFIGLNKTSYNSKDFEHLIFSFNGKFQEKYNGPLTLTIWNMRNGEEIASVSREYNSSKIKFLGYNEDRFPETGNYKAVLNTANDETFTLDFRIIK